MSAELCKLKKSLKGDLPSYVLLVNQPRFVCTNCGLLKEDRFVNQSSEYRYFNDDSSGKSDPRRVGNNVNLYMDSQIDLIEIDNGKNNYMTYAV